MNEGKNDGVSTADREIAATRIFDAPRELVWRAWTDPKHAAQWWGPNGFRNTIEKMDVKPGGTWLFTMHGPDGRDWPNKIVFLEVVEPERLVYVHGDAEDIDRFHVTVTFEDENGKTRLSMRSLFETKEKRDRVVKEVGAVEGMQQHLGRLAEHLSGMPPVVEFSIAREFKAPRELVWKAWTEGARLAQWWGPKGFGIEVKRLDLRPGGIFLYSMVKPKGQKVWGKFTYREIAAPERLVFINSFSDENGGTTRNPWFQSAWPLEIHNTLTLTEKAGTTTMRLRGTPINATEEERQAYVAMKPSMDQGFKGTLEQLETYLAQQ